MAETDPELYHLVRDVCTGFAEVAEQNAWLGQRWMVRNKTFAHVFTLDPHHRSALMPARYVATGLTGLTFRALAEEIEALKHAGPPLWHCGGDSFGIELSSSTDWLYVAELLTDSYCRVAPRFLSCRVAG